MNRIPSTYTFHSIRTLAHSIQPKGQIINDLLYNRKTCNADVFRKKDIIDGVEGMDGMIRTID